MRQDNFKCKNCGRSPATDPTIILHVDHKTAYANGGETVLENLQTLCSKCNIGKSNLEWVAAKEKLEDRPFRSGSRWVGHTGVRHVKRGKNPSFSAKKTKSPALCVRVVGWSNRNWYSPPATTCSRHVMSRCGGANVGAYSAKRDHAQKIWR